MEKRYWERFAKTGRIQDYLRYKGQKICREVMEKYEDKSSETDHYGNRNGAFGRADRRL